MTDTNIKKDLKEIANIMCAIGFLKKATTITKALDLINNQQTEIKILREVIEDLEETIGDLWDSVVGDNQ